MSRAIYIETFDPITCDNLDIIKRSYDLFSTLIIGISGKNKKTLFSMKERLTLVKDCVSKIGIPVDVVEIPGLPINYCNKYHIKYMIRSIRSGTNLEKEMEVCNICKNIGNVQTIFLPASHDHSYVSSESVVQLAKFGHCVNGYVTDNVSTALQSKLSQIKTKNIIL